MGFLQRVFGGGKKVKEERAPGGVKFKVPRVDAADLSEVSDGISDIFHRRSDGIIVGNVLSEERCRAAVAKMEQWETEIMDRSAFGKVFGQILVASNEDLKYYMAQNASLAADLAGIFGKSFPEVVEPVLQQMAGGRKVMVPEHPEKGTYKGATVRFMYPGLDDIEAHVGNEFITELPQYDHLVSLLHLQDQLSYFLLLQAPTDGGELVLFDLSWDDTPRDLVEQHGITRVPAERKDFLRQIEREELDMKAGDLIMFHGGRIWHKVNAVRGDAHRVTIGGFASISLNDDRIYYWS
ncbi:MAG: hypothetical protein AAGN35_14760 [Bacteroidota bacterium]